MISYFIIPLFVVHVTLAVRLVLGVRAISREMADNPPETATHMCER